MMGASHHEPFGALSPIDWSSVPQDDLEQFMGDVFADAQVIIESIPSPTSSLGAVALPTGRARAKTDSAVIYSLQASEGNALSATTSSPALSEASLQLRKEWKEIKVNPKENPLDISVYKLASKDGKGSWFARRSVHEGLAFEKWKTGLEREFPETMKVQGSPGSGNIRGIGADKNVESKVVDNAGHLNVFQLSAQFPGPTSPRDFITLLLTSDSARISQDQPKPPFRQYTIISKPCNHPECPPRQGIIRGQYESVEIIREIPSENIASKRSYSSVDLTPKDSSDGPSAVKSSKSAGVHDGFRDSLDYEDRPKAIEWLMITRSDPGGSVPRFLIEKGTPPGIVGDASKFLNWVTRMASKNFAPEKGADVDDESGIPDDQGAEMDVPKVQQPQATISNAGDTARNSNGVDEGIPSSNGLYGIITGAFGAATYVAAGLRSQFSNPLGYESSLETLSDVPEKPELEDRDSSDSETSSVASFASALEKRLTLEKDEGNLGSESNAGDNDVQANTAHSKELQRLHERRRKAEDNFARMQERMQSKRTGEKEKDEASIAKLREKHDKELAKQEAKYKRELRKLEEKREQEERKAVARRRKTIEREEKSNLSLELEKTRAERDVALKQIEILRGQVGDLQAQNTMLVAKYGRLGMLDRTDSMSSKGSKGSGSGSRNTSRTAPS